MTTHNEAVVIVNGAALTGAESMTLRVALSQFFMDLQNADALGDDFTGRAIREGYLAACKRVFEKMSG